MTDFKELREALDAQAAHPEFELGLWGIYTEMFVPDSIDHADIEYIKAANPSVIRALLAELDEARRDAERYRWLRDKADFMRVPEGSPQVCITDEWGELVSLGRYAYPQGEELDDAIDAMKEQQP